MTNNERQFNEELTFREASWVERNVVSILAGAIPNPTLIADAAHQARVTPACRADLRNPATSILTAFGLFYDAVGRSLIGWPLVSLAVGVDDSGKAEVVFTVPPVWLTKYDTDSDAQCNTVIPVVVRTTAKWLPTMRAKAEYKGQLQASQLDNTDTVTAWIQRDFMSALLDAEGKIKPPRRRKKGA